MTKQEALKIPELDIHVTPLIEDAFYAFRDIDTTELDRRLGQLPDGYVSGDPEADRLMKEFYDANDVSERAHERWLAADPKARYAAYITFLQMNDNIERYGYPCLEWWPD